MIETYKHHSFTNSPASSPDCSTHSFTKTAVIYARYSSDNQTEQSIEGQLRVCEQYAKNNDILILHTYIDRAMTGTNDNRPDFQQMIKDSAKKEWQNIIVYKLDRFSRNKYETAKYKKILKDNGVKLLSAMENIPDTPEGIILESLLEGMAEYYSAELSQKLRRGMKEIRLKGHFQGGYLLYGYKIENHKILIDEEKAEIVRYIYKQYSLGTYVKDIMKELTDKHIYHRGKPFTRTTIYNMLKNEKYFGVYKHDNEIYDNMFPAIVPEEIYKQVRQRIDLNKYGKKSVKTIYLLRNKLKCGYCGMPISAETGTSRNGQVMHYYKCLGRKRNNGCAKTNIRKEEFENFILENLIKILNEPKNVNIIIDNLLKTQEQQSNGNALLLSLKKEQKQTKTMLDNILRAIEQGIINNTTNKRMKELETQLEELEKQILIEKSKNNFKLNKQEIKEYYIEALKLEPKLLIDYLIKEMRVFDDKIEITFNTPIKRSPNNKDFLFYFNISKLMKMQVEIFI